MSDATAELPFYKERSFWVAAAVTAISGFLLFYFSSHAPLVAKDQATPGWRLNATWYATLVAIFTGTLSVGFITLIYESALKVSYARDLGRFLRLKASLTASGLSDIVESDSFRWSEILNGASEIVVWLRDPTLIFSLNGALVASGRSNKISLTYALPDTGNPEVVKELASQLSLTEIELTNTISLVVPLVKTSWTTQTGLRTGSTVKVVHYPGLINYDLIATNRHLVCLLPANPGASVNSSKMAMCFESPIGAHGFPGVWLRGQLSNVATLRAVWEGKTP